MKSTMIAGKLHMHHTAPDCTSVAAISMLAVQECLKIDLVQTFGSQTDWNCISAPCSDSIDLLILT